LLDEIQLTATTSLALSLAAHPNPFNPRVRIQYSLPRGGPLRLSIYDLAGRLVRNLLAGEVPAGEGSIVWEGDEATGHPAPSGIYLVQLQTDQRLMKRTVTLVR
jgi:hypothetical protein